MPPQLKWDAYAAAEDGAPMCAPLCPRHAWEFVFTINNKRQEAKHHEGYLIWCPTCGTIGKAPCRGHGLEPDLAKVTHHILSEADIKAQMEARRK